MDVMGKYKKTILVAGAALIVLAGIVVAVFLLTTEKDMSVDTSTVEETGFQTILPGGKTIKQLGGWQRISPLNTAPVYAFSDKIGDVSISVSQQPLPTSFANDIDGNIAQLATAYSATNSLDAGNTKIYIGTSAKGPQSTIFAKNSLLVLIKSQENISNNDWIKYVNSLR